MSWVYKDSNKPVDIELDYVIINCHKVQLPVYCNFDENSEISLIQLYEIYTSISNFFYDTFYSHLTHSSRSAELLPYEVVSKLNALSTILMSYFETLGVYEYLPVIKWRNMNPHEDTPLCQYFYEEINKNAHDIKEKLEAKGVIYLPDVAIDTDWGVD